ncbi:MAG: hypothetical protein JWM99_2645 [Verrucomicrobiales bacterium]|nr:hypothetical protein [Verrucomicrobiales bacterium]
MQHLITYFRLRSLVIFLVISLVSSIGRAATAIPPSAALNSVSTFNPGFKIRVVQADSPTPLTNTVDRAEQQLAGTLIDPATGTPFANVADLSTANADGNFFVPGVINYSTTRGGSAGNFIPDDQMPGLPGNTSNPNQSVANVAMEISAYLDLKAGSYRFGVNAEDGFSASVRNVSGTPLVLAQNESSGETAFDFSVSKEGFYSFRFVYFNGADEGSLELFSIDPQTDDKILLNDPTDDRSVKAYYQDKTASVVSLEPEPNAESVPAATAIGAVIFHDSADFDTNTIRLILDGGAVTPSITIGNDTNYVKVAYQPPTTLADGNHIASLIFAATGAELTTNQWNFKVGLPAEIRLSISRVDNQLTVSWTGGGTLQESGTVDGPWTDRPAASGSFTTPTSASSAFYRVHRP